MPAIRDIYAVRWLLRRPVRKSAAQGLLDKEHEDEISACIARCNPASRYR
jgi:hypothetical protein